MQFEGKCGELSQAFTRDIYFVINTSKWGKLTFSDLKCGINISCLFIVVMLSTRYCFICYSEVRN